MKKDHPLEKPLASEERNLVHSVPEVLIVMKIATKLDLNSLYMFMQVCRYTYQQLNVDAFL